MQFSEACVEACVMTPQDLTREDALKLLAAKVSKREIARRYGFRSPKVFYRALTELGLHTPRQASGAAKETAGTELTIFEALSFKQRLKANYEAWQWVLRITELPLDVVTEINRQIAHCESTIKKIDDALGAIRIQV